MFGFTRSRRSLPLAAIAGFVCIASIAGTRRARAQPVSPPLHLAAELGIGSWSGKGALSISVGAGLSNSLLGVSLNPASVLVRGKEDRRYREERLPGGEEVCRDLETGRVVPGPSDFVCPTLNSNFTWAPSAELHLSGMRLGLPLWLGVGLREGTDAPLTWSVSYLHDRDRLRRFRARFLYSEDAWHVGIGVVVGGG